MGMQIIASIRLFIINNSILLTFLNGVIKRFLIQEPCAFEITGPWAQQHLLSIDLLVFEHSNLLVFLRF